MKWKDGRFLALLNSAFEKFFTNSEKTPNCLLIFEIIVRKENRTFEWFSKIENELSTFENIFSTILSEFLSQLRIIIESALDIANEMKSLNNLKPSIQNEFPALFLSQRTLKLQRDWSWTLGFSPLKMTRTLFDPHRSVSCARNY
jgi:hypothetical protein